MRPAHATGRLLPVLLRVCVPLPVLRSSIDGITVAYAEGEIDLASAADLGLLREAGNTAQKLIVSLERCSYFDTSVVSLLFRFHRLLGDNFVVVGAPVFARRVLDITKFPGKIANSVEDGVRALAAPGDGKAG